MIHIRRNTTSTNFQSLHGLNPLIRQEEIHRIIDLAYASKLQNNILGLLYSTLVGNM
jgi:hypothetical protein